MVGHDLTRPYYAALIGGTKTYKPTYARLITGLAPFYHQALSGCPTDCLVCGRPVVVQVTRRKKAACSFAKAANAGSEIVIHCTACDWATNMTLSGLVMALPEAQRFWRDNPRMRALPVEEIETQGLLAYVTRLQSLSGAAELAVISRRDTFAPLRVHTNVRL